MKSITDGLYGIKGTKVSNIAKGMVEALSLAAQIIPEQRKSHTGETDHRGDEGRKDNEETKMEIETDTQETKSNDKLQVTAQKISKLKDGVHCRLIYISQYSKEENYSSPCISIDNEGQTDKAVEIDLVKTVEKIIQDHNETYNPETHEKIRFCELIILFAIDENKETTPPPNTTPSDKSEDEVQVKRPKRQAAINFLAKHKKETSKDGTKVKEKEITPVDSPTSSGSMEKEEDTEIPNSAVIYTSNRLRVEVNFVYPSYMKEAMSDLCISLNNLNVMNIQQIPLKLDPKNSVIMYYNTQILYPDASVENKYVNNGYFHHGKQLGSNFWKSTNRELKTFWRPFDKRINIDMLPCNSVHRISPYDASSLVSRSLMTHLLENRPLILAKPDSERELIISHALLLHGNYVYIHSLYEDFFSNIINPDIYGPETQIRKFRLQAFLELVESNPIPFEDDCELVDILENPNTNHSTIPSADSEPEKPFERSSLLSYRCSEKMERITKYFPYFEDNTILFSSRQYDTLRVLTHPIKTIITQRTINVEESETVLSSLQKLEKATRENEVKLFLNTKNSVQRRRDLYAMLWNEITCVFKQFSMVSPTHSKLNVYVSGLNASLHELKQSQMGGNAGLGKEGMEIEPTIQKPMTTKEQLDYASFEMKSM